MDYSGSRGVTLGKVPVHTGTARMISITQAVRLDLSQIATMFFKKKEILHLLNCIAALRQQSTGSSLNGRNPGLHHRAVALSQRALECGGGSNKRNRLNHCPSFPSNPTDTCTLLGLPDPSFQLLSFCQRDLSQFSIHSIWNLVASSIRDLYLRPTNFISLENLKLTLEDWLFHRNFYTQDFLCPQLQLSHIIFMSCINPGIELEFLLHLFSFVNFE